MHHVGGEQSRAPARASLFDQISDERDVDRRILGANDLTVDDRALVAQVARRPDAERLARIAAKAPGIGGDHEFLEQPAVFPSLGLVRLVPEAAEPLPGPVGRRLIGICGLA